jgi:hypothetical protein
MSAPARWTIPLGRCCSKCFGDDNGLIGKFPTTKQEKAA